ncbi:MAG: DNA polymerase III subunit delta' [Steroidobacteraceae bacterium]
MREPLLPWLEAPAAQLRGAFAAGRLPPALLLHEAPGVGAMQLAQYFAQLRFCVGKQPPCGECTHCRRVASGEHPDFIVIGPDPELKLVQISVDQIRDLARQLALSSYEGRGTVVVLQPADVLNRNAANALLKTLEEPRPDAHLLLLTSAPSLLPATVRSRCQRLAVPAPDRAATLAWLAERKPAHRADWPAVLDVVGIAPLAALEADVGRMVALREEVLQGLAAAAQGRLDVIRTAAAWAGDDLRLRLACIENCLTGQLLAMRAGARLQGGLLDINIAQALRLLDDLRELSGQLATSVNKPLQLERQLWRLNQAGVG